MSRGQDSYDSTSLLGDSRSESTGTFVMLEEDGGPRTERRRTVTTPTARSVGTRAHAHAGPENTDHAAAAEPLSPPTLVVAAAPW